MVCPNIMEVNNSAPLIAKTFRFIITFLHLYKEEAGRRNHFLIID